MIWKWKNQFYIRYRWQGWGWCSLPSRVPTLTRNYSVRWLQIISSRRMKNLLLHLALPIRHSRDLETIPICGQSMKSFQTKWWSRRRVATGTMVVCWFNCTSMNTRRIMDSLIIHGHSCTVVWIPVIVWSTNLNS